MDSFFAKIFGANEEMRQPRFAGTWYPSQSKKLDDDLSHYLQLAKAKSNQHPKSPSDPHHVLAIICPHAGYMFSGQTAAFAYERLKTGKYKRVFLLGPSHHIAFKGIALPSENAFATPLGDLQIDRTVLQEFLRQPYFHEMDNVFDCEHSLEMQLPWIRKTLGEIKLVPLAVGMVNNDEITQIADTIKTELAEGDLIVVSSDFTHYGPRFDYQPFGQPRSQEELQAQIKDLDLKALNSLQTLDSGSLLDFYESTRDTICGIYPCAILLSLLPRNTNIDLLDYATSQDMQRDFDGNSVSYMAIVCTSTDKKVGTIEKGENQQRSSNLSQADGQALLKIAKLSLRDYLLGHKKDPVEYAQLLTSDERLRFMDKRGVFVTLYKKSSTKTDHGRYHKELRGCIGYIYPNKPLLLAVSQNTINAACSDPRFNPVSLNEADHLTIEISVLTKPRTIANWQEIKLGQDGIVLRKGRSQSVFLPKVAIEFGWDLPQTLSQLSLKAGLSVYDWQENAQFEIFQSQSFSE